MNQAQVIRISLSTFTEEYFHYAKLDNLNFVKTNVISKTNLVSTRELSKMKTSLKVKRILGWETGIHLLKGLILLLGIFFYILCYQEVFEG